MPKATQCHYDPKPVDFPHSQASSGAQRARVSRLTFQTWGEPYHACVGLSPVTWKGRETAGQLQNRQQAHMLLHTPGPGHPQEAGDRVEIFCSVTPGKDLLNHLAPPLHGSDGETEAQRSKDVPLGSRRELRQSQVRSCISDHS